MKLLLETTERSEIDGIRLLLESRGIPVFIGNEDSARNFGLIYPSRVYALWITIDEQYEDALALLENPEHEVSMVVDIREYTKSMDQLRAQNSQTMFNSLMLVVMAIVAVILLLIALV